MGSCRSMQASKIGACKCMCVCMQVHAGGESARVGVCRRM